MDNPFENPNIIDISNIPYAIGFSFYSPREIRNLSNIEIICPVFFDQKGFSVSGGLSDSRMGINSKDTTCFSCKGNYVSCPGHFGHINFILPVQNPYLKNIFSKVLKTKCWYCNFFKISNWETRIAYFKFLSLDSKNGYNIPEKSKIQFKKKKLQTHIIRNKKKIFLYFKFIKTLTIKIKKSWDIEYFPRISFIEKNKRGKFWCSCLLFFLKLCATKEFCQKCKKKKVRILSILGEYYLTNKKPFLIEKELDFYLKQTGDQQIFSFSFENFSKICNNVRKNCNSKAFQLKKQIDNLWRYEKEFCEIVWGSFGASFQFEKRYNSEIFFLSCILVSPNRYRPIYFSKIKEKNNEIETNPQNYYFTKALLLNQQFLLAMSTFSSDLDINLSFHSFGELEKLISNLFDNYTDIPENKKKKPLGIKQRLEKKFGLFRMYMMGKRVFHSARSIIIPDPFLESFEAGIPSTFAQKLSSPIMINSFSYFRMTKPMERIFPRNKINYEENMVETSFGKKSLFGIKNKKSFLIQFIAICNKYKKNFLEEKNKNYGINRWKKSLLENDLVLLNRQPSLHQASLMSHSVKITIQTKCIRIHYSNCNSYNADFDGDEMNVHFPQNILANAESLMLSIAFNHAKIPTHNTLMRGLIQDNIITSVNLTQKDTFLSETILFHLVGSAIKDKENSKFSFCPAIIKPKILWTGKQAFSIVLKLFLKKKWLLNLESRTKITKIFFGKDETKILIRKGELLRGVIDASQIGRNRHGLFHAFDEIYGNFVTDKLLSVLCRSLVFFQRIQGFSSGLEDLILRKKIDKNRIKIFRKEKKISHLILKKTLSNNGICYKKFIEKNFFDQNYLKIISFLFTYRKLFEFFIIKSKNIFNKISSNTIESTVLGGMEKKFFVNGFLQMTITGAKGSILNVFQICSNLGQTELEEQFIPLGYGGKTLPVFPPFDFSYLANAYVFRRFSTGIGQSEFFFHCIAGREGLLDTSIKTSQSGYVQRSLIKHLESLKLNQDLSVRFGDGSVAQFHYFHNGLSSCAFDFDCFLPWFFQNFKRINRKKNITNLNSVFQLDSINKLKKKKTKKNSIKNFFSKNMVFSLGDKNLKKIISTINKSNLLRKNRYSIWNFFFQEKNFIKLYRKNLAQPGEPLGIITSHSLGEPCTQMTLNTFHFAGKLVSKNNSGIPRLKEIVLIASQQPSYPTMSVFFKKNLSFNVYFSFEKRVKRIFFFELIESINSFSSFCEKIPIFTFRFRIVSKIFFKHILGLRKRDIIKQIKFFWKKMKTKYSPKNCSQFDITDSSSYYSLKKFISFKNDKQRNKKFFFKLKNKKPKNTFQFFSEINFSKLQKKNLTVFGNKTLGFDKCIREIKRIKNGFVDYKEKTFHTEGINFYFFWKNSDLVDCEKIFTNNIFSMTTIYGIEAGRETLVYELSTIFKMQTISVNSHHIDLLSDYMMRLGFYRSLSRKGITEENIFQKITYETAIEFLINSSINQTSEFLTSTSSLISLGKICRLGTGNFDILFKKN
ncbi:DNA-directed RNA polymerase I chain-like protein (nucleomorph) [Chroomonas mesostigmatica CCMP1168]|uniref:DNA-directed RNA polymerase subunit n=1 Tax=Chroomonas mesostigmatica CCMP1168 TaxID=1195612 RepID=J7G9U6_9CRYP|nr:DNA-directed RNA polymerase I chain-like protein [Chroomonas mesostigmatica CCMP1168]